MSRAVLASVFLTFTACLAAQDGTWIQDFAKAKAQAKAEQKHLLLDFTGSDWCIWCTRLDSEVFSQAAFQAAVPKDFVLVKLDYPNDPSLVTDEVRAQNEKLKDEYQIGGFPTILLTDTDGRPYAQTGYEKGGPVPYVAMLATMKKTGDAFQAAMMRAESKQGVERATALDEALSVLAEDVVSSYHLPTMEEIVKLDADGAAGLKAKYDEKVQAIAMVRELDREAQMLDEAISPMMEAGESDQAIAHLDSVIQAPKSKIQHQIALFFKGIVAMNATGDVKTAIASLEAAKLVLPKSPLIERIERILPELKKQQGESGEEHKEGGEK